MLSPEGKYGGEEKHRKQRSPGSSSAPSPAPGRSMQGSRSASYSSLLLGSQQEKWSRPRLLKACFFTFLAVVGLVNTAWVAQSFVSAWQNNGLAAPAPQLNSTTLTVKVKRGAGGAAAGFGLDCSCVSVSGNCRLRFFLARRIPPHMPCCRSARWAAMRQRPGASPTS